jgi:signal transduction histidine kinase
VRLRYRLSLFFFASIALGSALSIVLVRSATDRLFRSFILAVDSRKARAYASAFADYRRAAGSWSGVQEYLLASANALFPLSGSDATGWDARGDSMMADRVVLADAQGNIVADNSGALLWSAHPQRHLAHGEPVLLDGERIGTALVGSMVDSSLSGANERFLASVTASLLWATLLSSALALLLGILLASRVSRPLAALRLAAKRVASGDLGAAVEVRGDDEISDLAASFNAMTGELSRLEESKKRIIADAAHELRTPVTLIRGTVEAMIDGVYPADRANLESLHEETLRLSRLIDALRELEIIESGKLVLDISMIDPSEAARKALALFQAAAREKSIRLELGEAASPPPAFRGDAVRVAEVLYNLVSNAISHAPKDGLVVLSVGARPAPAGGAVFMRVEDSGPGIPPDERERVFERFYRLDPGRSSGQGGRGLGLAIALEIMKAHGGTIVVEGSGLGGASFEARFPA